MQRFIRFLMVGGSATGVHYAIMAFLICLADISFAIASAVGYTVSIFYNYWANSLYAFGGGFNHRHSFPRFLVMAVAGLGINQIIFLLGIKFSLPIFAAQFAATIVVIFWNYFVSLFWAFSGKNKYENS